MKSSADVESVAVSQFVCTWVTSQALGCLWIKRDKGFGARGSVLRRNPPGEVMAFYSHFINT